MLSDVQSQLAASFHLNVDSAVSVSRTDKASIPVAICTFLLVCLRTGKLLRVLFQSKSAINYFPPEMSYFLEVQQGVIL